MNRKQYFAILIEWEKKYGPVSTNSIGVNLAKVTAYCFRCKEIKGKMHRHHTSRDFLFAYLFPDTFAARYIQFHHEDIELLCENCHKATHRMYDTLELNTWNITVEQAHSLRKQYKEAFYEWASRYRKRSRTK